MDALETLSNLRNKFELLKIEMPAIIEKSFQEIAPFVSDIIDGQMEQGLKGDGTYQDNYSFVSVGVYGKPEGPIRLYETGDFRSKIKTTALSNGIEITSTDEKTEFLQSNYGGDLLFTPTAENKERIAKEFLAVNIKDNIELYLNDRV